MKLHFESDLPYQIDAIEAVCDLFRGQEMCRSVFTVTAQALGAAGGQQSFEGKHFTESGGIGNALQLVVDEELSDNLQQVQLRNGLPPSTALKAKQTLDSPSRWRRVPTRPTCICAPCSSPALFDKFRDVDGVVARAQAMRG